MTARSVVLSVLLGAHPAWATASRTDPSDSGFRHQGSHAAGRADPDGRRGGPGALRGRLPALRPAAGPAATPGRRDQPAAEVVGRDMDDAGDHQRRHRCAHPRRAADDIAAEQVRRVARRRLAASGQCRRSPCRTRCCRGCGCCTPTTTAPPNWRPSCGICRAWASTGSQLLDDMVGGRRRSRPIRRGRGDGASSADRSRAARRVVARRLARCRSCGSPMRNSPPNWWPDETNTN